MKSYPFCCLLAAIIITTSCHFKHKGESDEVMDARRSASKLIGAYTNKFGIDTMVALYISEVTKDSVLVNYRQSEGNWVEGNASVIDSEGNYIIKLQEFNEGKSTGILRFRFNTSDTDKVDDSWNPADASLSTQTYFLQRKYFFYSSSNGIHPEASQRLLVDSDINEDDKQDLELMRNEIYARHGYCFKGKGDWEFQFITTDWYVPHSADVSKDLTDIEKKNIVLIKKYEKTAKDEDFGRE